MGDFSFTHTRVIPAGAAEAAPVAPTDAIVFDLPSTLDARDGVRNDALYVLAQGGNLAYELAFWNATAGATASFVVVATGTLVDGVPALVPFHVDGARVYIRSTGITAADIRVSCAPVVSNPAAAAAAAGLATEATLASVDGELVTANGHLVSIDAELVTANGALTAISGNVDGIENLLGQSEQGLVTIRTFAATVADAVPPAAGSMVALTPQLGAFELHLMPAMAFAGTAKASKARFTVWARNSTSTDIYPIESFEEYVSDLELAAGANRNQPRVYNKQVDEIFVTVAFLDGTLPTITGTIKARPVAISPMDDTDFRRDKVTGNPISQSPAHDNLTGTDKVTQMNSLAPAQYEPGVISETSRAIGTYYWPSADGIDMGTEHNYLGMEFSITGAGTSVATVTVESTIGGTIWRDVTLSTFDENLHAYLTAAVATSAGGSMTHQWSYPGAIAKLYRIKVVVTALATGAVSCSFSRKKMCG